MPKLLSMLLLLITVGTVGGIGDSCTKRTTIPQGVDPTLLRLSQAISVVSATTQESTLAIIDLNNKKLLADDTTRMLLDVVVKVSRGGLEVTNTIRNLNVLGIEDRKKLLLVLEPILVGIDDAINKQIINLSAGVREKVQAALVAIQSSLAAAKTILAAAPVAQTQNTTLRAKKASFIPLNGEVEAGVDDKLPRKVNR